LLELPFRPRHLIGSDRVSLIFGSVNASCWVHGHAKELMYLPLWKNSSLIVEMREQDNHRSSGSEALGTVNYGGCHA